jgi:hypothetical protein
VSLVVHWRNTLRDCELDRTAKLVGFVLSTYMDARGVAWPAKTELARGASLGRNPGERKGNTAVDGAINRLEAAGLLVVDRKRGRRGFVYGAAIPRYAEGFKSHADARDNGYEIPRGHVGLEGLEIPRGTDAKSHAERAEIPRPGVGESVESEKQSVTTARVRARGKKQPRANALTQEQEQRLARLDD